MGDTRQGGGGMSGAGGGHFRPHPNSPMNNPQLRPQYGPKTMASPEPAMTGAGNMMAPPQASMFPGGKMGPQYGLASNPFMWGGGGRGGPVMDASGNPANSNYMGTFNGHRMFMPGDHSW